MTCEKLHLDIGTRCECGELAALKSAQSRRTRSLFRVYQTIDTLRNFLTHGWISGHVFLAAEFRGLYAATTCTHQLTNKLEKYLLFKNCNLAAHLSVTHRTSLRFPWNSTVLMMDGIAMKTLISHKRKHNLPLTSHQHNIMTAAPTIFITMMMTGAHFHTHTCRKELPYLLGATKKVLARTTNLHVTTTTTTHTQAHEPPRVN